MSGPGQPTIGDLIQQRSDEIAQLKAWACDLLKRGSGHLGIPPDALDSVLPVATVSVDNIVTGKAPPTPPPGYNPQAPDQVLQQLDQQLAVCQQYVAQLRAMVSPDVAPALKFPVAAPVGGQD